MDVNKWRGFAIVFAGLICCVCSKTFVFENKGKKEIWVGTQGNAGIEPLGDGGWKMKPHEKVCI